MDGQTGPSKVRNKASESPLALPFDSFSLRPSQLQTEWPLLPIPSPGSPRAWGWGLLMSQTLSTGVALAGCGEGQEGLFRIVRGGVPGRDEVSGREGLERHRG